MDQYLLLCMIQLFKKKTDRGNKTFKKCITNDVKFLKYSPKLLANCFI